MTKEEHLGDTKEFYLILQESGYLHAQSSENWKVGGAWGGRKLL